MNYVTVKLTEDQVYQLLNILDTAMEMMPDTEELSFTERLRNKLAKAKSL